MGKEQSKFLKETGYSQLELDSFESAYRKLATDEKYKVNNVTFRVYYQCDYDVSLTLFSALDHDRDGNVSLRDFLRFLTLVGSAPWSEKVDFVYDFYRSFFQSANSNWTQFDEIHAVFDEHVWKNEKVFLEDLADVNHDLEKMQTRKPNDKDKRADSSRGTPRELTKQDQQRLLQVHILSPQEFAGRFEGLRRSVAKEKAKVKPQDIQNAIFREMLKSCRKGFCAVTAGDEGYVDAEEFSAYAADHPEILIPIVQLRRLVDDEILSGSCPANYRERRKKRSTGPPGYDLNADYKVFDLENLEKSIESIKRKKEREAEKKRQMHNRTVGNLGGTASLTPDPMGPNRGPGTLDRASKKMAKFAGGLLKKDKPSKGKEEED